MSVLRLKTFVMCLGFLLVGSTGVLAHDPGLSAARLTLSEARLSAHLTFARKDIETLVVLDADGDGVVTAAELDDARPALQALAGQAIEIRADRARMTPRVAAVKLDSSDAVHFLLELQDSPSTRLRVSVPILSELAMGHRHYVSLREPTGNLIAEHVLAANSSSFDLVLASKGQVADAGASFSHFVVLGVEHILLGYDHLLFLFGLLVVGSTLRDAVRVITSFTVAHSITLALATWNVLSIPPEIVEPLIAASVAYVGVANLLRRSLDRRALLTFGFGLVHGLGFATVLGDLGVVAGGDGRVLLPLFAFNVGVELGQIAMTLVVLPVIGVVRRRPRLYPRFAAVASVLVTGAGTLWLCERVFS